MKTNRIALAGAIACMALVACTRDPLQGPVAPGTEMVFTATLSEGPGTKTVLQDDGATVYWTKDEDIKVFFGNSMSGQFHSTNANASLTATFSGSLSGNPGSGTDYWALYPYDPEAVCDGSSVTMTIPAVQQGVAGTFANKMFPMLAKSSDRNLAFYNVCGGARFSVTKPGITAVTFRAIGGQTLAGKVKMGFGADGKPLVSEVIGGVSEVTVTAPEGGFEVGEYYFATLLPAVLEGGISMSFQMTDGTVDIALDRSIEVRRAILGMLDNIGPVDVTGVSLNLEEVEVPIGGTQALVASIAPDGATNQQVIWSSSDPDVASVDENGIVTAHSVGQVTITATTAQGGFEATCTVTVSPISVTEVTLDQTDITLSAIGATKQLNATVVPANATEQAVSWTSSDPEVATVSENGLVTAKASGTTTIKAAVGGKEAICTVTVNIPVTGVSLNITSTTIYVGSFETLTPTVAPTNATNKNVTWSSNKPAVASVDEFGNVTAVAEGTATITVKTVDGGKTATCTVEVKPVAVTSVTLNESSLSFSSLNTSQKLAATVKPDNATYPTVTWSSSEISVATVASDGTVTAKGSGSATITATADGKSASCQVNVQIAVAPTSISLDVSNLVIAVNETVTLNPKVLPENATNKNVTWTVSDSYVSVTDGVVKGVVPNGQVTVTARTSNGLTASCTVQTIKTKSYPIYYEATDKCEFFHITNSSNTHIEAVFGNVYDSETKTGVLYCNEQPYYIDIHPQTSTDLRSQLTGINIPSAVVISEDAFRDCRNLARVTLPGNLKSIYARAFDYCTSLNSIVIPEGVTTIGSAFGNCASLSSISLPSTLTTLAGFAGCTALSSVTVPESVTSVAGAFRYCSNLTSFTRNSISPDGRALVLDNTLYFVAYSGITSYTVPSGVTTLGEYCLDTNLTSITLPASVTDMTACNFYNWDALTLTINATTPPAISSSSEYFDPDLSTTDLQIIVPGSAVTTYKSDTNWKKWAKYIKAQ